MAKQIKLPNNCRYSIPSVHPADYKENKQKLLKEKWYVKYRFFDDNTGKQKQVVIRVNEIADLKTRQAFIKETLEGITKALEVSGWNPITKKSITAYTPLSSTDISPHTPFIDALNFAYRELKLSEYSMRDIKLVIAKVADVVPELGLSGMSIGSVSRKHVRMICNRCALLKDKTFSNDKYNRYRAYLGILYNELTEFEAVEANIPYALATKEKAVIQVRETLSKEHRVIVDTYLHDEYPNFWRFLHIFFHSGSRETEMMLVKVKDVDVAKQQVTYLVKKGRQSRRVARPMKDLSVQLWKDAIAGGGNEQYVFAKGLKPGDKPIQARQITRRWDSLVKQKIGITVDFYALKHLNSTEVKTLIGGKRAAILNAETETMVDRHYDTEREQREHEKIKSVNNPFV